MKKRIEWIDVAKGLGMMFVMFAHANLPSELQKYIYTFHMPLFFFISGFLFSIGKYKNFNEFLKSKVKSLLIPYLIFSMFNYIFYMILRNVGDAKLKPFLGIFISIRGTEWTMFNGTLWFVPALFMCEILLYFIIKLFKDDNKKIVFTLLIFSIVGYIYNMFIGIKLIWNIDASLVAITFVGLGYVFKRKNIIYKLDNYLYILIFMIINLIFGLLNQRVDMFSSLYGNYFYFYISAIAGTMGIILICKKIKTSSMLEFIGKNSFIYLAMHQSIVFRILRKLTEKFIISKNNIILTTIAITYVIFTIIILYIPIKIINKYFPCIVGKKRTN